VARNHFKWPQFGYRDGGAQQVPGKIMNTYYCQFMALTIICSIHAGGAEEGENDDTEFTVDEEG
jgi:hypothetical protein